MKKAKDKSQTGTTGKKKKAKGAYKESQPISKKEEDKAASTNCEYKTKTTVDDKSKDIIHESKPIDNELEEQKDIIKKDFKSEVEETPYLSLPTHFSKHWNILKDNLINITNKKTSQTIPELVSLIKECVDTNGIIEKGEKIHLDGLEGILSSYKDTITDSFLTDIVPFVISLALRVESLFDHKNPLKLLMSQTAGEVELNRNQIGCLLAHCFLCSLPLSRALKRSMFKCFYSLYSGGTQDVYKNKLLFLINYFDNIRKMKAVEEDKVKYTRLVIPMEIYETLNAKYWLSSKKTMQPITIKEKDGMESVENGIIVDFANKYLGGGVLRKGAVQEEILFLTMPELLPTQFMCEKLADNEAMLIQGLGIYSRYSGYKDNLCFEGSYEGNDKFGHSIIAMDALHFTDERAKLMQFQPKPLLRELNKAFVAFDINKYNLKGEIVTGRWGCGAFKGHAQLKMMIQWLAASESGRELVFCSFGDKALSKAINIVNKYSKKTVGEVFHELINFQIYLYDNLLKNKKVFKACDVESFDTVLFDHLLK